jgi:hypothetical protein
MPDYVIVIDDWYGGQVIGPFKSWNEANKYYKENYCSGKIRPFVNPPQSAKSVSVVGKEIMRVTELEYQRAQEACIHCLSKTCKGDCDG